MPLSFAQQRLWFIHQLEPESAAYNIPMAVRLSGELQLAALEQSLGEIVRRHEVLRTRFELRQQQGVQVIEAEARVRLRLWELSQLPAASKEEVAGEVVRQESGRGFDLRGGPVLRAALLRLQRDEHVLVVVMHHIASDGWSTGVLVSEFSRLYEAYSQGRPSALEELRIQYADYAVWQRQYLQGAVLDEQLSYWREQLAEAAVLELPTDRVRPAVASHRGGSVGLRLSAELTQGLRRLSRQQGVTMFMTLLAAFKVVLSRYSGQREIAVGTPIAGRNRKETEELIGLFINTLVLRTDMSGDLSVRELLGRVRETALSAYAHQEVPFERLVEELQPERSLSHEPLFQVMFTFRRVVEAEARLAGIRVEDIAIEEAAVKFDLELGMVEAGGEIRGKLEYAQQLYDDSRMERMAGHLVRLLEQMVADGCITVGDLKLLSEAERQQLLEWNSTQQEDDHSQSIVEMIERQALTRPDAVGVVFEEQHLSYAQLNIRANQLAHHLRRLGVNLESRVAIVVERGLDMVIGFLGTLKAGAAYVPLDPSFPRDRLLYTLEDSAAPILLTQQKLLSNLTGLERQVICLDADWETISGNCEDNPQSGVLPENAAYVIYTSGSTGVPKGVLVQHRALANYITWVVREYDFKESDRLLQFASPSFDTSAEEIYTTLAAGATLVLRTDSMLGSPSDFARQVARWEITILDLPTSFWHAWAESFTSGVAPGPAIRLCLIGGEAALYEPLVKWHETVAEGVRLANCYGPTESTIAVTQWSVTASRALTFDINNVPIGRPVTNVQAHILDQFLEPAPIGVIGELCIGGAGLARGYLNRSDTTAEKFVPDHLSGEVGGRLYRTGDRTSYKADGNIEFLGRVDNQVKLRGFRIELAEIEAGLIQHPQIQQVAVVCREDKVGQPRLVAYFVAGQKLSADHLRKYLQSKLPPYMLPAAFQQLPHMPLTTSGKIDRRALPTPELQRAGFVGPRNHVEEVLCDAWAKLLGLGQVGITDNFFELGGDSILSIQVIARAREEGVHLTPKQFFQYQTIAELAEVAELRLRPPAEAEVPAGPVALTPIEYLFFDLNLQRPDHYNQSAMLELKPGVESGLLEQAVEAVLQHHEAFRLRFERDHGQWLQCYAEAALPARFSRHDLSRLGVAEQRTRMQEDAARTQASLNLREGALVRAVEYDLGVTGRRLLLVIHHLAVDGVSWRILLEDVEKAYEDLVAGRAVKLPAKTSSLRSWAQRLQQYSREDELRQQAPYWLSPGWERASMPTPVDDEQAENTVGSARTLSVWLTAQETRVLMQEVPSVYHTQIHEVLLTALGRAYQRWSGNEWMLIDLEGHGREDLFDDIDVSRTVGWFTSIFPVGLRLASGDAGEALKQVKEQLRRVPGRGIGYGVLRYLGVDEDVKQQLRDQPRAQISFNYLGQFDPLFRESRLFKPAAEGAGSASFAAEERPYLLDINGLIVNGQMRMDWTYSEHKHHQATIRELAAGFIESLRELIQHCQSPEAGGYTPSDFPDAAFSQDDLDRVVVQLGDGSPNKRIESIYSLSGIQQGMLFHSLFAPGSGTYVEQMSCRLQGKLDLEAFKRAWQTLVDRHAILRTSFVWEAVDEPLQVVHETVALDWRVEDWRGMPPAEQSQALEAFLRNDRQEGFDFRRPSLMRVALLRCAEQAYYLVWTCHHLLLDGWCQQVLIEELFTCYEQYTLGSEVALDQPRPYRDYIRWLRQQDVKPAESFWRDELRGITAPTPLVWDTAIKPEQEGESREQGIALDFDETRALEEMARGLQVTVNTVVEAAWALVLSRHSGQSDVVFGATVSGRSAPLKGIERMVGPLINTLPVRVQVKPDETVRSYLKRVQERQGQAVEFDYTPLMRVQGWSEMGRGARLFDSLYVFENYPVDGGIRERARALLQIGDVKNYSRTNYPLAVMASPGRSLHIKMIYPDRRMEPAEITRVLEQMKHLLKGMVRDAEQYVGSLSLFDEACAQQLLIEWNDTGFQCPQTRCIHERFQRQAAACPDAVAAVSDESRISYGELNRRANQLAHSLRRRGVGPETRVGICLGRTPDLLVALLGVFKSGGAYVGLDPNYPRDRLRHMLHDAGAHVLLTAQSYAATTGELPVENVYLDRDWESINRQSRDNPTAISDADNLAYVIYTSGSTGGPKGVPITHRNLDPILQWSQKYFGLGVRTRTLQNLSPAFDFGVFELLTTLIFGGTLYFLDKDMVSSPSQYSDFIGEHAINTIHSTPTFFREFIAAGRALESVQTIHLGGEPLTDSLVGEILGKVDDQCLLYNGYGPTEASVNCSIFKVGRPVASDQGGPTGMPIGRATAHNTLYILDDSCAPAPMGAPGELHVGGDGLSSGYLNRPDLTAEKFIPNPFANEPGARLYKTGDRVRYRSDGNVEFLGRIDQQVKVRGYRIELGEVEAAVNGQAGVKQSVVVVREAAGRGQHLVCYVVAEASQHLSFKQLREQLSQRLPDYMLPSVFVELAQLPLTANGKLDRKALPAPASSLEPADLSQAPRSPVEQALCRIFAETLRLPQVGIHDNFFELGGDSIISIQIVGKAQRAGLAITPRQIFQHPTIAELAAVAGTTKRLPAPQGRVSGAVPLTPIQARFFRQQRRDPHHYNLSVVLEGATRIDPLTLQAALTALCAHHDQLGARFWCQSGQWYQETGRQLPAGFLKFLDLSSLDQPAQQRAWRQAAAQMQASLSLEQGRLLRVGFFDLGRQQAPRVLIVAHHLVVDTVSWGVLLEDLELLYGGLRRGQAVQLPEKTTSYQQWAAGLEEYAGRGDVEIQEGEYWRGVARQRSQRLPHDYEEGDNTGESAATVTVGLSQEETQRLVREAGKAFGSELQEVLVGALVESFCEWSGGSGVKVELEGHGREEEVVGVDLTRSVGWFTSVYPVWIDRQAGEWPGRQLERVREQLRRVPQRGIGYGILRYLKTGSPIATELDQGGQGEICFNYLGQFDAVINQDSFFRLIGGPQGSNRSPHDLREYTFEINCWISRGRFQSEWAYSRNLHRAETVEQLAESFIAALRGVIADRNSRRVEQESELKVSGFDVNDLDSILAEIKVASRITGS
ncbi:MAG TPA: amino acid adenylation domain-containing protein [Blastocatellia bacterium]|nr:amino acid adenylation domain-containing protein [Blastocatellia bacterium]